MKKYIFLIPIIIFTSVIATSFLQDTHVSAQSFNPGLIVDDAVFTNTQSMNVEDIQNFLRSKVPNCDTNGTQQSEYGGGTRSQWASARYGQSTFTCLKDYSESGKTSSQIIYDVSNEFQINPQVLIVLLQKEQGLVTDTWPLNIQYRSATGYGCPDTAPCDSQYYGLTNQLRWAARMFRAILNDSPTWYTPYELGINFVQYNPTASCGGSTVNIQNRSTQALYNYTPYQPNQAAIDAPMGQTVSCGAYGNLNFYRYFSSWFGSTITPPYQWRYMHQAAYTDQNLGTKIQSPLKLSANQKVYMTVSALNTGTRTWTKSGSQPMKLGTSNANDRTSILCDTTWQNCTRPASLAQNEVKPGEIGTFGFWANIPSDTQYYKEFFNIVVEGQTWLNDPGLYFDFTVMPTYKWEPLSADFYTNTERTQPINNGALVAGEKSYVTLKVKNIGNRTWSKTTKNPIRLGSSTPNDRISALCADSWIKCDRAVEILEQSVVPGQIGSFQFEINNPINPTFYGEAFNIVVEDDFWMQDAKYTMWLKTNAPKYSWEKISSIAYVDQSKSVQVNLESTKPGQKIFVSLSAKNTGNTTWRNTGEHIVKLGTSGPRDRTSKLYSNTWLDSVRPTKIKEPIVMPGEMGTFEFWITTPSTTGEFRESFNILVENRSWLTDTGLTYVIRVAN